MAMGIIESHRQQLMAIAAPDQILKVRRRQRRPRRSTAARVER